MKNNVWKYFEVIEFEQNNSKKKPTKTACRKMYNTFLPSVVLSSMIKNASKVVHFPSYVLKCSTVIEFA